MSEFRSRLKHLRESAEDNQTAGDTLGQHLLNAENAIRQIEREAVGDDED